MTLRPATASAPGKVILMGEHAVVYGCPAVVASVGLRTTARIEPREGEGVELDLPALGHREETSWAEILDYTRQVRAAWREYAESTGAEGFERVRRDDPAHLVRVALGEAATDLGLDAPPSLRLRVESELPVGAGFGSSAAAAVSVVAAALAALGEEPTEERVDRLALEVERRQHGRPSGVDHKTVLLGGILRFDWSDDGELRWRTVPAVGPDRHKLALFHTGEPAETTGEVVAAVRALRDRSPERFADLLMRMRRSVEAFDGALRRATGAPSAVADSIRDYEECLEELGVVPAAIREVIRVVAGRGGRAKISGAGALSGESAGCLLVNWTHEEPTGWPELAGFRHYPVRFGVEGLAM